MIDPIYKIFSPEDCVLFLSLFINIGIVIDYLERKHKKRKQKQQELATRKVRQAQVERINRIAHNNEQVRLILKGLEERG